MSAKRTEDRPHDRLTRMCDAMVETMDLHPERQEGDRAIVMLTCDESSGIVLHGYQDDSEAVAELFVHLAALFFEANGKRLMVVPIGRDS